MAEEKTVSKVVLADGRVLIDLTSDTVEAQFLHSGITAHDKSGKVITGSNTYDSDTSDATVAVSEILATKTAYARGTKLVGTMPNNGGVTGTISTRDQVYVVPNGYHDGSGKVSISSTEQAKLVSNNIRSGITILGVEGSMSGSEDVHAQELSATPKLTQQVIAPESGYNYLTQVTVAPITVVYSDNTAGGQTVTIGAV